MTKINYWVYLKAQILRIMKKKKQIKNKTVIRNHKKERVKLSGKAQNKNNKKINKTKKYSYPKDSD